MHAHAPRLGDAIDQLGALVGTRACAAARWRGLHSQGGQCAHAVVPQQARPCTPLQRAIQGALCR